MPLNVDANARQIAQLMDGLRADDAVRLFGRLSREHPGEIGRVALLQMAWRMGGAAMRNASMGRQVCRICGCWDLEACPPTCSWVEPDLCSACAIPLEVTHVD